MKRPLLFVLLGLVALAAAARFPANASTVTKTYKVYPLTILITPGPAVYRAPAAAPAAAAQPASLARRFTTDPLTQGTFLAAGNGLASDVPLGAYGGGPFTIAQAQKSVPVQFNAKADPYAAYLKITPQLPIAKAGYGSNTYPCALQVFGYYPNQWRIVDWVYGTTNGATGVFPTYNYPAVSSLSWLAEGITTSFQSFYNNGSPGEVTFGGAAGQSLNVCIDLQLNVPATIAPGYYSASIQYTLQTY